MTPAVNGQGVLPPCFIIFNPITLSLDKQHHAGVSYLVSDALPGGGLRIGAGLCASSCLSTPADSSVTRYCAAPVVWLL